MYHPLSGKCVMANENNTLEASDCLNRSKWSYTGDESPIWLMGTSLCLNVVGDGLPVIISSDCSSNQSTWRVVLDSKLHIAARDAQGRSLCLESNPFNSNIILTRECLCLNDDDSLCNESPPQIQWFTLISRFILTYSVCALAWFSRDSGIHEPASPTFAKTKNVPYYDAS
ncbi:hypothetical protein GIB67_008262 [Kingdonia uniflora]|uniref:Ricin B lectin domain-containing protein n=1 Tax=Kingdonia uniflora TaxID=39325 RepID=A0A7J7N4S7_9MAGN|nr:hypothetical protein GIB67_008262 [Kingdonia uniflora]